MKRVLLTGMGGGVGLHILCGIMHLTDWEVVGTDSFKHKGYTDRISFCLGEHPDWIERVSIITHDLTAPFTDRQIKQMGKIDIILNLASLSDVQLAIEDPVTTLRNNSELMITMLELARNQLKPEVFLQFSTDEVYGPAKIDQAHPEWDTIAPSNPYSASKAAQEAYAISYWRSYGLPLIITNTMNNFGEMQSKYKYPVIIQKCLTEGKPVPVHVDSYGKPGTRYYIHSRNVADALVFLLNHTKPTLHKIGEDDLPARYNIVGDVQLSNLELAQSIADMMHLPLKVEYKHFHEFNPGHDNHYGLDGSKLAGLGWKSPLDYKTSMASTIRWQEEHREWIE